MAGRRGVDARGKPEAWRTLVDGANLARANADAIREASWDAVLKTFVFDAATACANEHFSATNRLLANERDGSDILFRHPRVVGVSETMRVQHENHLHGSRCHAFCVQRLGA